MEKPTKASDCWTIHAGRKDWRKGGKPICGIHDAAWCFLSPGIEAFWARPASRRCKACEQHPDAHAHQGKLPIDVRAA